MSNPTFRARTLAVRSFALLSIAATLALASPAAAAKSVVLPWIAQTRGALAPSTHLFVHNPGRAPLQVSLALVPPAGDPVPCARLTVAPNATAATTDARRRLCGNAAAAGVLVATVDDAADAPVVASTDTLVVRGAGTLARTAPAMHGADAALPGQAQHVTGLRQGDGTRTALWLYNPSTAAGEYDVIYRTLDGSEIGTTRAGLGPGKMRQLSPSQHPIPAAGPAGPFTVEIAVRAGALLGFGIVGDEAGTLATIVRGETR